VNHEHYKKERRAELLDESACLIFKVHHNLQWVSHYTPDPKELAKFVANLKAAVDNLEKVIDDRLFDPPPKFTVSK